MTRKLDRTPPADVSDARLVELTEFACRLADASGPIILSHFRAPLTVDNKAGAGAYDPVTEADRGAETAMRDLIKHTYPDHGVFGEEHGYQPGDSALTWVIDPLDGTRSFVTGALHWGTLIGLYDGTRSVLGVVDQPYTGERFIGNRRGASLLRYGTTRALKTRRCERLEDAALYTTSPDLLTTAKEREGFARLASRVRLVRYGGDCYSYCMLALGYVDLVVESGLEAYDVQAIIPIVQAAGGMVTTWDGGDVSYGGRIIAAGSREIHAAASALLGG